MENNVVEQTLDDDNFIRQAKEQGYSYDEIQQYLSNKKVNSLKPKANVVEQTLDDDNFIRQAKEQGYSYDEIQQYLSNKNKPQETSEPDYVMPKPYEYTPEEATDLASAYENINSRWSTTGKLALGAVFSSEASISAMQDIQNLNKGLVEKLREKNINAYIDPDSGELMMQDEKGNVEEISPGILDSIVSSKFETGGAIAGAIAGAKYGAELGTIASARSAALGPVGKAIGATAPAIGGVAGAFIGSAAGAFGGSGVDYIASSYKLKDKLEAKVALSKMIDAGVGDATMTILTGGAWKFVGRPIKNLTVKTAERAFNIFKNGNVSGAYQQLLKDYNITKEQAEDLVEKWQEISNKPITATNIMSETAPVKDEKLAIKVLSETVPGGEAIIKAAEDSTMSIVQEVNKRAKNLIEASNNLAPGESGATVRKALQDYQIEVGNFYEQTKALATNIIDKTDYRFDIKKLAIEPALLEAKKHIDDPMQVERFTNTMRRINQMAETRTFSDLLDLRQAVNSIKAKATKKISQDALKKSIMKIDSEIQKASNEYLSKQQAKVWRSQFKRAKKEYSKMKQLESNVLFKAIVSKKGVTEDQIVKKLTDLAPALDDTFVDVMNKLPKGVKDKTEGAVLKLLTNKYTAGLENELQAINFPMLANVLNKYTFKSKSAIQYKDLVNKFAKVFKNDVNLAKNLGYMEIPKFQSYLTTDVVQRTLYQTSSGLFNYARQFKPGAKGNRIALVKTIESMIENPLNATNVSKLVNANKNNKTEVKQLVKNLQEAWVKAGLNTDQSKEALKLYKATTLNKITKTNGGLGSGYYLKEQLSNARELRNVLRFDVKPNELATIDNISKILNKEVTLKDIRTMKDLPNVLKNSGFKGIRHEGKVVLFDKPQ